jgi:NAD(P)-dependent dehydrogenase (short-subunit alcohol dehydrogenase family)
MPLAEMTLEQAKQLFDVRFWGFFMAAKAGARFIKRGGSITTTCGTVGLRPQKGWVVTAAVVGSVESFTRALAIELAPIRVNAVCAGVVDTNLWSGMPEPDKQTFFANHAKHLPVGRVGHGEDVAQAYLF